jgi:hypothetical protein
VVVIVNDVGIVDGGCGAIARGDVVHVGGVNRLSLACTPVSQVLGGSVDIPALFNRCGILSLCTICITALTVVVVLVGSPDSSIVCFPLHCLQPSLIPAL